MQAKTLPLPVIPVRMSAGERFRRVVRGLLPRNLYAPLSTALDTSACLRMIGVKGYLRYRRLLKATSPAGGALEPLSVPTLLHPIYVRPATTDALEVIHSTVRQTYARYLPNWPVRAVIDAGAYIGDTAAWYLSKYPKATVLAIEPEPENFGLLERNCKPYGERARLVHAALWPESRALGLRYTSRIDAVEVLESDVANHCQGVTIPELMRTHGLSTIDILKLDIEDAEFGLFSSDCDGWLRRTRMIVIEIHSPRSLDAVLAATARNGFSHTVYRDLHFFRS